MNLGAFMRMLERQQREEYPNDATLSERIDQARAYVDARLYRAEVVDPLPPSAPAGKLMVTPGDSHLYVGRGQGNTLARASLEILP